MPFDANDEETKTAIKEAVEAAVSEAKEGLEAKNKDLLGKLKKAKEGASIDPSELAAIEAERDALANFAGVPRMSNTLTALAPLPIRPPRKSRPSLSASSAPSTPISTTRALPKATPCTSPSRRPARPATSRPPTSQAPAPTHRLSTGVVITASKKCDWNITGEQLRSLENAIPTRIGFRSLLKQGMRTLRNAAEVDAWLQRSWPAHRALTAPRRPRRSLPIFRR
jgi:hypothetical protein